MDANCVGQLFLGEASQDASRPALNGGLDEDGKCPPGIEKIVCSGVCCTTLYKFDAL
jgi:hypothetical protein